MKFFTDKSVKNDYLLIKITDFIKLRNRNFDFSIWKEIFIDPNVYELKKHYEYSWINDNPNQIYDFLNSLQKNHYFTVDYPSDMNLKYQDLFIEKSWINANKYVNNSQYIVSVQFKHNDFWNFVEWFDKYNCLNIKSQILGIGNLCRYKYLNEFMENILDYAISNCNHKRIHIYGLSIKCIPLAVRLCINYDIELSIDSTKWTRACTKELKENCGISCNRQNRQIYFNSYIDLIESKIKDFSGLLLRK